MMIPSNGKLLWMKRCNPFLKIKFVVLYGYQKVKMQSVVNEFFRKNENSPEVGGYKFKAHLVAQGYAQKGVEYNEILCSSQIHFYTYIVSCCSLAGYRIRATQCENNILHDDL